MKYFKNCKTAEELKKEYRKLAMKLHPDIVGGDGEAFKEMQNEFEKLWEQLKNVHSKAGNHRDSAGVYTYYQRVNRLTRRRS